MDRFKKLEAVLRHNKDRIGPAEMERLYSLKSDLDHIIPPEEPFSILDAGCGRGVMSFYLLFMFAKLSAVLVDINENYSVGQEIFFPRNTPHNRFSFKKLNLLDSNLKEDHPDGYDLVINIDVIEHVVFFKPILQKLWETVKEGGYLYINTPSSYPSPNYPLYGLIKKNIKQRLHHIVPRLIGYDGRDHVRHGYSCKYLKDYLDSFAGELISAGERYITMPWFPPCSFKPRTTILVRKGTVSPPYKPPRGINPKK